MFLIDYLLQKVRKPKAEANNMPKIRLEDLYKDEEEVIGAERRQERDLAALYGEKPIERRPSLMKKIEQSIPVKTLASLGYGTSQDIADLLIGGAKMVPSIMQKLGVPAEYAPIPGIKKPDIIGKAPYPLVAEAGRLTDPLLYLAPEARLASLGKFAKPAAGALTGLGLGALYGAGESPEEMMKRGIVGTGVGAGIGTAAPIVGKVVSEFGIDPFKKAISPFVKKQSIDILNKLKRNTTAETVAEDIYNRKKEHYKAIDLLGSEKYKDLNNFIPDDFKFKRDAYENVINDEMGKLNKSLEQYKETRVIGKEKEDMQNILKDFKLVRINDFGDADLLKKDINEMIGKIEPGNPLRKTLHDIKEGLRESVKDSAGQDSVLKEKWTDADRFHREEVIPFERLEGEKQNTPFFDYYLKGKGTPEKIASKHIKASKADETKLLKQYLKMAPDQETRDMMGYEYLKGTEDDPQELINRYGKLGKKQRKLLYPNDYQQLDKLHNLNKRVPGIFREPREKLETFARFGAAGGLLGAHSPIAALVALGGPPLAAEVGEYLMSNPQLRELYLKGMISGKLGDLFKIPAIRAATERL